ncbi:MAG TPA: MFS transporter [Gaiellaceae bacterium]|nr:MFS transporter [Gaiellaceae bacterium]
MPNRYRWLVLAAGTAAQTAFSVVLIGLPVLAPQIRHEYGLDLVQVGFVLDSVWIGGLLTLLPWGLLADRVGERIVLALGLSLAALALAGAAYAGSYGMFLLLLGLAGAAGASVNAASGRAIMYWFPAAERGLALGVRQTAVPIGGFLAALVLPALGLEHGLLFLAALSAGGALFGVAVIHDPEAAEDVLRPRRLGDTLRDGRLWLLCSGSGFYLVAQIAITSFVVLFLYDERGFSRGEAAAVLAVVQVLAAGFRIGGGRWSDVVGSRLRPLRLIGVVSAATLGLVAVLVDAPAPVLVAALIVAGGVAMAWNGLSYTAAAELAGRERSGAALGMQQTALAAVGAAVPPVFAAVVSATSWRAAFAFAAVFPLAGALLLRSLRSG